MPMSILRFAPVLVCCVACADAAPLAEPIAIGAAIVDITPDYPVRLTGYGNRLKESEGVAARIHARALVIGGAEKSTEIGRAHV